MIDNDLEFELSTIDQHFGGKRDLIIFDVGAYDCYHSGLFKGRFPHARVYAFEAEERNWVKMAPYNGIINLIYSACSDVDGAITFYKSTQYAGQSYSGSGSICKPEVRGDTNEGRGNDGLYFDMNGTTVNSIRLDTYCTTAGIGHIDYLHMDVQGAEMKVLKGLGELRPALIYCEVCELHAYETGITIAEFNTFMDSLGYELIAERQFDNLYKYGKA